MSVMFGGAYLVSRNILLPSIEQPEIGNTSVPKDPLS